MESLISGGGYSIPSSEEPAEIAVIVEADFCGNLSYTFTGIMDKKLTCPLQSQNIHMLNRRNVEMFFKY